jgi:phage tail-like protein
MPPFTVNPNRFDPYKDFKFRVSWDGRPVAGVSGISALRRTTDVVIHREGNEPSLQRKSPGLTNFAPIVLERGRTHDADFERWANKVYNLGGGEGNEVSLNDFRKDIVIDLFNEAGQRVMSFVVFRAWPSEYTALGELEANGSAVAFESLTLEHEGWERDLAVKEPQEKEFDKPKQG